METFAVIPARGGSKGLHRKNVVNLAGRPLIAYSILAALNARLVDRVVVSTEDDSIADVAREWGAEVPFMRPRDLADDDSDLGSALEYSINQLGGHHRKRAFVILYPTSPFRTPELVDNAVKLLADGYDSVGSVKRVVEDHACMYEAQAQGLIDVRGNECSGRDRRVYFRPYGSLHAHRGTEREKHHFIELKDRCMLVDIDSRRDLDVAEMIMTNSLFDFGMELTAPKAGRRIRPEASC